MQILIADDHALVRDGLKLVLQQLAGGSAPVFFEANDYQSLNVQIRAQPKLDSKPLVLLKCSLHAATP